jgi:uncharacterized protein YndB with AHSA1/START domain
MKLHKTATDRIEKEIVLRAPRSRVWRALANAQEFGAWFGVTFEGSFKPGQRIEGQFTSPGNEHLTIDLQIERMDPENLLSYRWHPYAIDPAVDYSDEPTTLVEFRLEDAPGGTHLTVVESGFDGIPLARRAEALRMNDDGWAAQLENIERHVAA